MTAGQEDFKNAVRKFASGVTIVTVSARGTLHGMTASAFSSVSLEPPRILVCLAKSSQTRALVMEAGAFAVNILAAGQEDVARAFSRPGLKPFADLAHHPGADGTPLLDGAIAWIECRIASVIDGGDHDIVLGEVDRCDAVDALPLVYFDRCYRSLTDP